MWKKDEATPTPTPTPTPRQAEVSPRPEAPRRTPVTSERAVIGRSITIRGDVTGDEDLLIQGQIEGSVDLELHAVTVGSDGLVKANITGRVITVEGEVEGDLHAQEQITLRSSARVNGDIKAPRVVLDDGASFRGLVDMGDPTKAGRGSAGASTAKEGNASSARTPRVPSSGNPSSTAASQESSSTASA
jgi:cytoskeletal protein CcmA (bactofilin family)